MSHYDVPPESPYAYLDDAEIRAWFAFMKVQLRLRYEMNAQLRKEHDISLADYDVLVALTSEASGAMTISELAIRIGAERSRVSHQAQRMARNSLVILRTNGADGRSTLVALTDHGRQLLAEASPSHISFVRSVFFDALDAGHTTSLAEAFEGIYELLVEHGSLPRPADHP